MKILAIILFLIYITYCLAKDNKFIGCYQTRISNQTFTLSPQHSNLNDCIKGCNLKYYKYSMLGANQDCICNNYLGLEVNSTVNCDDYCQSCDMRQNLTDVYLTGSLIPGPPRDLNLTKITDSSIHIQWSSPESFLDIISYQITANKVSNTTKFSPVWSYPNNTFQTELINLQSGTVYNITICAESSEGCGVKAFKEIETKIQAPDSPIIVSNDGTKMTIKINPVTNSNRPITSYLVIVVNEDSKDLFDENSIIKSLQETQRDSRVNYYITAEIKPYDIDKNLVIGDGNYYGKYYNPPLNSSINYKIIIGAVSRSKQNIQMSFSKIKNDENNVIVLNTNNRVTNKGDSPAVIIGLSIAIGLLTFMLIVGIIGFLIIRSRVVTNRRHRLSDNQELSLQGPMIEVENNGYIPEEEHTKANHYKNLKQKLQTIPYNQLKIDNTSLLGIGKFGKVNCGILTDNPTIQIAIYTIQDKKLNPENKRSMLKELDVLIKTGKHENIITLIGTCETTNLLYVILEYVSMNLKDLLLGSRDSLPGRFSNMSEDQAFNIAIKIVNGMSHLENNKIVHKQLCARSILITPEFEPKISEYGLAQYHNYNNLPDYTRWTALEVFKGQQHNLKSDVWSFACLLWEICVLGGTPYGNFPNNEIPDRIMRGLRLPQMPYFSDELYQIMLNCWQVDMDERPNFKILLQLLNELKKESTLIPYLNFNLYSNFQYEQFYPDMEIVVRPVF